MIGTNPKLTVAVNCWVLRNKNLDGIGYFTINTLSRIIRNNPEVEFLILCDKNFNENYFDLNNVLKYKIFPPFRHPLLYFFYLELILPFFLKKHKPDIFVSVDGFLSILSSCVQLPVIHDLNFEYYPKDLKLKNRLYYRFFFKKFARKAKRIATVSEYSKNDIVKLYGIDSSKIDVVYLGVDSSFSPLTGYEIQNTREKWSNGKPYFFFIGSMYPRKNIKRLIEAFNLFKLHTKSDHKLLLGGAILWGKSEIEDIFANSQYKEDIIFTGRLSDRELQFVLGASFTLTYVSIFEGFGLPIIEAMQCGVPVICSNVTSMPEIAGNAAVLIDPLSIESIADGMEKLYKDDALRSNLIERGYIQHKQFTWNRTADLFWNSIKKALEE